MAEQADTSEELREIDKAEKEHENEHRRALNESFK